MRKKIKNFGPFDFLAILIFVAIIGFVGWIVLSTEGDLPLKTNPPVENSTEQDETEGENEDAKSEALTAGGLRIESIDESFAVIVPSTWFYQNGPTLGASPEIKLYPTRDTDAYSAHLYMLANQCPTIPPEKGPQTKSFDLKSFPLNDVTVYRSESVDDETSSTPGQRFVSYVACKKNTGYFANYVIPAGDSEYVDEFDSLMQTWQF